MRSAFLLLSVLFFSLAALGQVNAKTNVVWPPITGSGAPTSPCTTAQYGMPYQDTSVNPNVWYTCGSDGWQKRGSGGSGGLPPGVTSPSPGSLTGTGTFQASLQDTGGQVYNVKAYGAKGDGTTNDCAAITSANAAKESAGGGTLLFPAGYFNVGSSCNISITVPTVVSGAGGCTLANSGTPTVPANLNCETAVLSSDPTGVLFSVSASYASFTSIGMVNTVTPTAGSAVLSSSSNSAMSVNLVGVYVNGFYDDIDQAVGRGWIIRSSYITNPVRYGVRVRNTVNADFGDWVMEGNLITGSNKTTAANSAAIEYESSGGGKIINNKIVQEYSGNFVNGILMNVSGSMQTLITSNNIEGVNGNPINIVHGWAYITISNNYLLAAQGFSAVNAVGVAHFYLGGGNLSGAGTGASYAVTMSGGGTGALIMPFEMGGFTSTVSNTGISSVIDNSGLSASNFNGVSGKFSDGNTSATNGEVTVESTGSVGTAGIVFNTWLSGTKYPAYFSCSYYNDGCAITLPRRFGGGGFLIWDPTQTVQLFGVDAQTGAITSNAGGTFNGNVSSTGTYSGQNILINNTAGTVSGEFGSSYASGDSNLYLFDGGPSRYATLLYAAGVPGTGTVEWQQGLFGSTAYTIHDQVANRNTLVFPSNVMPANSLGGNANGATAITQTATDNSTNIATTAFVKTTSSPINLPNTTAGIGGSALAAGACATGTATVGGSTTSMSVAVSPQTYPGDGFVWEGYISAAGTATVKVCAIVAGTPTTSAYNVRVIQ